MARALYSAFLSVAVAVLTANTAASQTYEDWTWTHSPATGHWYGAVWCEDEGWLGSQIIAENYGGYLATVADANENTVVHSAIPRQSGWLGITNRSGHWEWVTGEPVTFENWGWFYSGTLYGSIRSEDALWHPSRESDNVFWGMVEVEFDPVADSDGGGLIDAYEDFNHNGVVDPWETDPNNPADDLLVLSVRDFQPGQRSAMRIWNGTPLSSVWILYSLAGGGPTDIGFGFLMDLAQPIQVASKVSLDANGALSWTGPRLPAGAPLGTNVWIQGLQLTWNAGLLLEKTNGLLLPIGAN